MNIDRALEMINHYLIEGCINTDWRECLSVCRETIKSQQKMLDAAIAGQETLQNYHHNATEIAYKNGYEAGVRGALDKVMEYSGCKVFKDKSNGYTDGFVDAIDWYNEIIDKVAEELIGGSENED